MKQEEQSAGQGGEISQLSKYEIFIGMVRFFQMGIIWVKVWKINGATNRYNAVTCHFTLRMVLPRSRIIFSRFFTWRSKTNPDLCYWTKPITLKIYDICIYLCFTVNILDKNWCADVSPGPGEEGPTGPLKGHHVAAPFLHSGLWPEQF